jgi:sec-independent protein translocase protein TatA
MSLGPLEIIVILFVALLIFGPKNLPKLGSALGKTVKNVREGMEGDEDGKDEKATETEASIEDADADADASDENVKFCPKCGTKNPADSAFCSKCGAKFE